MNSVINKQLFTSNATVAQLSEHETEDLRRNCWSRFESKEFCKKSVLIFIIRRFQYFLELVVIIPLLSTGGSKIFVHVNTPKKLPNFKINIIASMTQIKCTFLLF